MIYSIQSTATRGMIALMGLIAGVTGRVDGEMDDPPPASRPGDPLAKPPTAMDQYRKITAEWDAATRNWGIEAGKAKTEAERNAIFARLYPDELDYYRRCLELAETNPRDPGAREALLWVVLDGMRNNDAAGKRMGPLARAVEILVRDFADEPRVARAALRVDNLCSPNRTSLCRGLFERATNREAKGVACLALAQILAVDASEIGRAHKNPVQPKMQIERIDDSGKPRVVEMPPRYDDACWQSLRSRDEAATLAESKALYHRVIEEYADIPYNPWRSVDGKVVANPRPKKLAEVAEGKLDDMQNLIVGKPAPEAEGVDLTGKPLKLSDHKGKAVLLVFWFAGCGPCMAAVPKERELVEKLKGRPFVLLGVNSDDDLDTALGAATNSGMTWPSFRDGSAGDGPIANRYHIRAFPTVFLIDDEGVIRLKQASSVGLEETVEKLVVEAEARHMP